MNPYESPGIGDPTPQGDLLKLPAWGCLVSGVILLVFSVIAFCYWQFAYGMAKGNPDIQAMMVKEIYHFVRTFGFSLLAIFVAWCLWQRKNRWTVVVSSILGLITCVPGPLAAIILLRMRRREVWEQFDRSTTNDSRM